ncbi:hypothetical protein D3C81_1841670 [compost metagenome]
MVGPPNFSWESPLPQPARAAINSSNPAEPLHCLPNMCTTPAITPYLVGASSLAMAFDAEGIAGKPCPYSKGALPYLLQRSSSLKIRYAKRTRASLG